MWSSVSFNCKSHTLNRKNVQHITQKKHPQKTSNEKHSNQDAIWHVKMFILLCSSVSQECFKKQELH